MIGLILSIIAVYYSGRVYTYNWHKYEQDNNYDTYNNFLHATATLKDC